MLHVTNDAGGRFQVRCIHKGGRYGLNNCLTHERDDPLIEFLDITPAGGLMADGLFVARCPVRRSFNAMNMPTCGCTVKTWPGTSLLPRSARCKRGSWRRGTG